MDVDYIFNNDKEVDQFITSQLMIMIPEYKSFQSILALG